MKMFVQNLLAGDAYLMIGMLETQLVKRLLKSVYAREIEVDSIKHLVIGNTSFYNIIYDSRLSLAASCNIIKPSTIVCVKDYTGKLLQFFVKFINIEEGFFSFA